MWILNFSRKIRELQINMFQLRRINFSAEVIEWDLINELEMLTVAYLAIRLAKDFILLISQYYRQLDSNARRLNYKKTHRYRNRTQDVGHKNIYSMQKCVPWPAHSDITIHVSLYLLLAWLVTQQNCGRSFFTRAPTDFLWFDRTPCLRKNKNTRIHLVVTHNSKYIQIVGRGR